MNALVKNPAAIRLGIVGYTPGNGHPYSWSAIINGFDRERMNRECVGDGMGFTGYLNKIAPERLGIAGVRVTHVACEGIDKAAHIAAVCGIDRVCPRPEAMIGQVDAVIVATDIGGEHVRRAHPFIAAGVPLFIDKPLCDRAADLAVFEQWAAEGAKFLSSSSMRYAKELVPYHRNHHEIGRLLMITMPMCKSLETYGIHALEAVYPIVGPGFATVRTVPLDRGAIVHLHHASGVEVVLNSLYDSSYGAPVQLYGTQGSLSLSYGDSFSAFRAQLCAFVDYLRSGVEPYPRAETFELMRILNAAIASRDQGGELMML